MALFCKSAVAKVPKALLAQFEIRIRCPIGIRTCCAPFLFLFCFLLFLIFLFLDLLRETAKNGEKKSRKRVFNIT